MGQERTIRDPIHGFVRLNDREARVVAAPVFQRLRRVRQLAFAYLVYPGAHHTRFEHALGVCHIAGLVSQALGVSDGDRDVVRLAALMHDLGHGPFSHVSEAPLKMYAHDEHHNDRATGHGHDMHELITRDIIRNNSDLRKSLGEDDCDKLAQLLGPGYGEPLLRSIVSGPLDADKQDYLLRDSHFCGVKYGVFDIHQLHRSLAKQLDPADSSESLVISPDGVHAVEQFVMAKYYMTTQVYAHKVRLITDQMLLRAIQAGVEEDEIDGLREIYAYDGTSDFAHRYVQWDDERFMSTFCDENRFSGTSCCKLLNRLRQRRLLKRVYQKRLREFSDDSRDAVSRLSEPQYKAERAQIEERFHDLLVSQFGHGLDDDASKSFVILNVYKMKSVRAGAASTEGQILVGVTDRPKPFEEESLLFRSTDEKLGEVIVEVYAPVSYETKADRRQLVSRLEGPITEELEHVVCEESRNENS